MSKTGNLQALAEFFQMQKVSTFNELTNKFACNERTIQRYLKELDSITSYTHSGHYITLAGVPRFDRNGIWFYKTIGFTKYKNSLELIVRLINSSRQGITRDELQEITGIQIFQQIQTLLIRQELHRVKLGNKYLYVPEEASKNKTKRFKIVGSRQIEEHHIKGVEINNLVAVLKIVLQEGQIEMRFLEQWIKKYSLTISFKQVKQLVEKYTLTEKKNP